MDKGEGGVGRVSRGLYENLQKHRLKIKKIELGARSPYKYFFKTFISMPFLIPHRYNGVYHAITPMEGMWLPKDKSIVTFLDLFTITDPDKLGAGFGYHKRRSTFARKCFKEATRKSSKAKRIACISDETRQSLLEFTGVDEKKVSLIRLGINKDLRPLNRKHDTLRIGYLGQMDRRKRTNLLVTSFMDSKIDAELWMGGNGWDERALRVHAKDDKRVKFFGYIPDSGMNDFYNSLDVFVFPSWVEGYGLPCVEAMACGKPVVVLTDSKIPMEVKSRCAQTMSLTHIFGNPAYLDRITRSVRVKDNIEFARKHSWEKCAENYIKLYEEVLG